MNIQVLGKLVRDCLPLSVSCIQIWLFGAPSLVTKKLDMSVTVSVTESLYLCVDSGLPTLLHSLLRNVSSPQACFSFASSIMTFGFNALLEGKKVWGDSCSTYMLLWLFYTQEQLMVNLHINYWYINQCVLYLIRKSYREEKSQERIVLCRIIKALQVLDKSFFLSSAALWYGLVHPMGVEGWAYVYWFTCA